MHHHIVTNGPPVFSRPRRLLGEKLKAAKQDFDLLLFQGVIRPSSSQWASPLNLVAKAGGGWRSTGDFRRLNAVTVPDRYPIPRIEDLLLSLHRSKVFKKLGLNKAYFQVPVAPKDIPKTAVTTPFGFFEFLGMPLGLRNATQTFQRHMDNLFRDMPFVRNYVDDMLIASENLEEHLQHLQAVFELLAKAKLSLNLGKCKFAQNEVRFLDFAVDANGFRPSPEKVEAILKYSTPTDISGLRRFLGLINFYHALIPNLAAIEVPLTDLMHGAKKKDKRRIDWTPERVNAFNSCKKNLAEVTSLSFLAPEAPLELSTDASSTDLGAALNQLTDGIWHPIGFHSRKLTPAAKNYSPYDRELLAIYDLLKHFEHELEGRQFVVKTDHKPLIRALEQRPEKASPRQLHQLDFISQFCLTLEHIEGKDNVDADALSRVEAIDLPSQLNSEAIHQAQQDEGMAEDHELANSSLILQYFVIDEFRILCDTSHDAQPLMWCILQRTPAVVSRRACLKRGLYGQGSRRMQQNGRVNALPVSVQKSIATLVYRPPTSMSRISDSAMYTWIS